MTLQIFFDSCLGENDSDALIFEVNETSHCHFWNVSRFSLSFNETLEDNAASTH